MITLTLSEEEAEAFIVLLDQASDEFSNHGCNDFDVMRELELSQPEANAAAAAMRRAMIDVGMIDEDYTEMGGSYLYDWMLLSLLRCRLQAAMKGK
jgi:hypothetical protein